MSKTSVQAKRKAQKRRRATAAWTANRQSFDAFGSAQWKHNAGGTNRQPIRQVPPPNFTPNWRSKYRNRWVVVVLSRVRIDVFFANSYCVGESPRVKMMLALWLLVSCILVSAMFRWIATALNCQETFSIFKSYCCGVPGAHRGNYSDPRRWRAGACARCILSRRGGPQRIDRVYRRSSSRGSKKWAENWCALYGPECTAGSGGRLEAGTQSGCPAAWS